MFSTDPSGNKIPTSLHRAILHAAQSRDKIFIVAYNEVSLSNISNYFIPCAQYIENPFLNNGFSATNAQNIKTQYKIPPNVWFVLNLNSNESIAHIPGYMGDRASFIRTEIGLADSNDMILPTITKRINYYQLNFLIEKNKKQYQIDEVDWKKIDRLESYISSRINYSFEK